MEHPPFSQKDSELQWERERQAREVTLMKTQHMMENGRELDLTPVPEEVEEPFAPIENVVTEEPFVVVEGEVVREEPVAVMESAPVLESTPAVQDGAPFKGSGYADSSSEEEEATITISHVKRTRWTPKNHPHWTQQDTASSHTPVERRATTGSFDLPQKKGPQLERRATEQQMEKTPKQTDSWKRNTWSYNETSPDGPQAAYALRVADSREQCGRCRQPLGSSPVMTVPSLGLKFHGKCFTCHVCRSPLSKGQNTNVLMQNNQPHCRYCYSNEEGKTVLHWCVCPDELVALHLSGVLATEC